MIIAVDGPAASGKGTIARALARHFKLPYLDTGLLYRAVGMQVLRQGGDPASEADAFAACAFSEGLLADDGLRTETAGAVASIVSVYPSVRAALIERQRSFAGQDGGAVLDGRDIGTVIAPEAQAKLFVTASADVRAARRHAELLRNGHHVHLESVLADIHARDARDSRRATAPLRAAPDAALLDTSDLGIEAAVDRAIALVEARMGRGQDGAPGKTPQGTAG